MTLNKLRINKNEKGFTLIELMIVIAIIGILAAIAIPNFISYRDKAFCSAAESDAASISSGLADYFAIPSNVSRADQVAVNPVKFPESSDVSVSGNNVADLINDPTNPGQFIITVYDRSNRCPSAYMTSQAINATGEGWKDQGNTPPSGNYFQKTM